MEALPLEAAWTPGCAFQTVRRELKYVVDASEAGAIELVAGSHVPLRSRFPPSRDTIVRTDYFDYVDGALTARSLSRPDDNLKVRFKRYEDPARTIRARAPSVWLEVKARLGDCVMKDRMRFPGALLPPLLGITATTPESPRLRALLLRGPLVPVACVSYRRVAFEARNGSLRITIDREIELLRPGWEVDSPTVVARLALCILEIKLQGEVPAWLQSALHGRSSGSISKFDLAARALGLG